MHICNLQMAICNLQMHICKLKMEFCPYIERVFAVGWEGFVAGLGSFSLPIILFSITPSILSEGFHR